MIVKHARINLVSSLVRYQTPLSEILPKYNNLSGKTQLNGPVLRPELDLLPKISLQKTGGFMSMGNWFRLESYTKQNHCLRRLPCKKPYSIWMKNKKVIQKVNWEDKLETPCI